MNRIETFKGRKYLPLIKVLKYIILLLSFNSQIFDLKAQEVLNNKSQTTCLVKLNKQDCITCMAYIMNLAILRKDIKIELILLESYEEDSTQLKSTLPLDTNRYRLVFSDSIYRSLDAYNESYVTVLNNLKKEITCFPLVKIGKYVSLINIGDSLRLVGQLPESFTFQLHGNQLFIFDYSRNEIKVFSLQFPEKNPLKIKISKFHDSLAFVKYFKSFDDYSSAKVLWEQMKVPIFLKQSRMISFDVVKDTLFVITQSYYPKKCIYNGKVDTCIMQFYSMNVYKGPNQVALYPIRNIIPDSAFSMYNTTYEINPAPNLNVSNVQHFITGVSRSMKGGPNYFIGNWELTDGAYEFTSFIELNLSKLLYKYSIGYEYTDYIYKQGYVLQRFSNELVNLDTKKSITLKFSDLKDLIIRTNEEDVQDILKFKIIDFIIAENKVKVLYGLHEKIIAADFNIENGKLNNEKVLFEVKQNQTIFKTEPILLSKDKLLYFPLNSNLIKIMDISQIPH